MSLIQGSALLTSNATATAVLVTNRTNGALRQFGISRLSSVSAASGGPGVSAGGTQFKASFYTGYTGNLTPSWGFITSVTLPVVAGDFPTSAQATNVPTVPAKWDFATSSMQPLMFTAATSILDGAKVSGLHSGFGVYMTLEAEAPSGASANSRVLWKVTTARS